MEQAEARFIGGNMGVDGLFVHDFNGQGLYLFDYHGLKVTKKIQVSSKPLWTAVADQEKERFFFGGADGVLHQYHLRSRKIQSATGHSQGITSMIMINGMVVTGSDDKSIAIWDNEQMEVVKRKKAHESLVNFMVYDQPSELIWSSSSDHTIKAWSWPGLEPAQEIQIPKSTNAGFWIDHLAGHGFSGEWSRNFNFLEKENETWQVKKTAELDSICLYRTLHMPKLDGVFGLSFGHSQLLYYHIPTRRVHRIILPEFHFSGITKVGDNEILIVGQNTSMIFECLLDSSSISFQAHQGFNTRFKELGCGAALNKEGIAAAGNNFGEVFFINKDDFPSEIVLQGRWQLNGDLRP